MNTLLEIGLSNALVASGLALAAAAAGYYCKRPAVTHGLWLLVLIKLITPPLVSIPVPWLIEPESLAVARVPQPPAPRPVELPERPVEGGEPDEVLGDIVLVDPELIALLTEERTPAQPAPVEQTAPAPAAEPSGGIPWKTVLLAMWLAGSLGWLILGLIRIVRFQRLLRHARPAPERLKKQARHLAEQLGLARCPEVGLLPGRLSPMLWAVGRSPRLLLPAGLLDQLIGQRTFGPMVGYRNACGS